jgi:hypothetical protein
VTSHLREHVLGSTHREAYTKQHGVTYDPHKFSGKVTSWKTADVVKFVGDNSDGGWAVSADKKETTHQKGCKSTIPLKSLTADSLRSTIQQHETAYKKGDKKRTGSTTKVNGPAAKKQDSGNKKSSIVAYFSPPANP